MKKSAFISDVIFTFGAFALFTLCLFRFLRITLIVALLLALLCGALAAGAAWAYLKSKRKAALLKRSEEREKEKLLTHLALLSDEKKTEFFKNALTENGVAPRRLSKLRLIDDERFCFLSFRFAPVTADEVSCYFRRRTSKQKILLCNAAEKDAEALCKKLNITLKTGDGVYALLKEKDALPKEYLGEPPKRERGEFWRICFSKRNAKRFFMSGSLILACSLLSPFPYYYLVFGSILLLSGLAIRIFGCV